MRASKLKETLQSMFTIRRTVAIEGAPGGGKTTIVKEVAKELGVPCVEVHMPTMLVEDFGVPMLTGDYLNYKLPEWFPSKAKHLRRASSCSMIATKHRRICRRSWLTSVKQELYMVWLCPMGGRLCPLVTASLTRQVLTRY